MRVATVLAAAAGLAGGLAAGLVLAIPAYSAHAVVRPRRDWRPDHWQEPDWTADVEHVQFENAYGHRLAGWLVPPQPGQALAIVCHGFGTNRREGLDLLPWLREHGYGGLFFDFQAHGESDGRFTTVGFREADDVVAAVRYVQERLGDDVPIVAVGFSMGASVAILAAARCPAIRAVVADSPFATLQRVLARSFRAFFRLPPRFFARPTIWFAERIAGGRVGSVLPLEAVAAIAPRPLLLIQGTEDAIIDPEDSVLLFEAAGEPKTLWCVAGAGHVQARARHRDEYFTRVKACLAQALEAAASGQ